MAHLLIVIIYLAFISLGLPDSLLGSGWTVMHTDLGAPLSYAGLISMIISLSTIISALFSDKLTIKIGTGFVTAFSVMLTAVAMLCFSFAKEFWQLCLLAIPYGLGAGAIDACLNNYIALHYSSRHMSWLHCCWGIGATISPYIMGACLAGSSSWMGGYRIVSIIQFVLMIVMFASIRLWKMPKTGNLNGQIDTKQVDNKVEVEQVHLSLPQVFKVKGTILMFVAFFCYCAVEQTPMLWASTYFVNVYGLDVETAANLGSLFFIGMTVGRGICGFVANKIGDKNLIRIGTALIFVAILIIALPTNNYISALVGFILSGLGCAPIYPSIVHSTPYNFGEKYSQSIIGVQMAFAYLGTTFIPTLFGLIAEKISIQWLPVFMGAFAIAMFILCEIVNIFVKNRHISESKN